MVSPDPDADAFATPRPILEALPVGIWVADAGGRIVYQNPAARRILAVETASRLTAACPSAFEWNTLRPVAPEEWAWRHVLESGEQALDEVVAVETDQGTLRSLILSAVPIGGPGRALRFVVVVAVDGSALVHGHEKLRHSVSLGRATLEAVTNGVLVVDMAGKITIHNRLFADMWSIPDEVLAEREDSTAIVYALEQVSDRTAFLGKVRELYAKTHERSFDVIELKDGRVFERYSIPQLLDGEPVGRVWSFWDVTERRRREAAHERALEAERRARAEADAARERFAILANVAQALAASIDDPAAIEIAAKAAVPDFADLCIVHEIAGSGELRRVAVAHADPAKAALAERLRAFVPRDVPFSPLDVARTGRSGLVESVDEARLRLVAGDDEHFELLREVGVCSALTTAARARGRTLGTMTFLHAESNRHFTPADRAFGELLASRVGVAFDNARLFRGARAAVQARDEVLSVVSHDLRTPLAAILASASLMRHVIGPTPPADEKGRLLRHNLDLVQRATRRMSSLIEDLLDAARLEARLLRPVCEALDPARIVQEAVGLAEPLALQKGVSLGAEVGLRLPRVLADARRVHQVFSNLLGNAVKFTPPGGSIVASASPHGSGVVFSVEDSGPGIDARDLERVFDRFWQGRKAAGFGVGLGLSIAKGIVEAHGGRIWATSQPGRGATLSFTLPAAPAADRPR